MIKRWKKFEGSPNGSRRGEPRVTIHKAKTILLNKAAWEKFGSPEAVEMYFDERRNVIGLKPIDPAEFNAFPVKPKKDGTHRIISAGSFCTHNNIKVDRTELFENPAVDPEGYLELDLTKTITVARGSR